MARRFVGVHLKCHAKSSRSGRAVRQVWQYLVFSLLALLFFSDPSTGKEIGPEANFCAEINALQPGNEVVLRGGTYKGPCTIRRGGRPGAPTIIRAENLSHRPWIVYEGQSDNVINIRADYVTIRGLNIGPTQTDVDGIRIYARSGITIEDCQFSKMGGIAVVASHNSTRGVIVRRNVITNTLATAMYFGCHDGSDCVISDLAIENNSIHDVTAPDPAIGYGIQVKLNSTAVIRDNRIVNTKGPGIMVYGSQLSTRASLIERNYVSSSRTSSGILIGGGPVIVRNNISVLNRDGGVGLQDYASRGLLREIVIVHNTTYANDRSGVFIAGEKLVDVDIVNNAGIAVLPDSAPVGGVRRAMNIDCAKMRCFTDPARFDLSPAPRSVLLGAGVKLDRTWMPSDDFFQRQRTVTPSVGAIEFSSRAVIPKPEDN
jgi:Right handed beta helix region